MAAHDDIRDTPFEDLIDRLVDGELSSAELRRAVARLDSTPDGWRRCAIAFLEAQSLKEAVRCGDEAFAEHTIPRVEQPRLASATSRDRSPRRNRVPVRRAIAAALALAAFTLGWAVHGWRNGGTNPQGRDAAPRETSVLPAPPGEVAATDIAWSEPAPSPRPQAIPASASRRLPDIQEVARVPIGSGSTPDAEVPILAGSGLDERWLSRQPPPVSEYQQALWERQGYHLEQDRRLVSVPLADGRRAAIPVDQVRVRYVGRDPL